MTNIIFSAIAILISYLCLIGLILVLFRQARKNKSSDSNFSFRMIMMFFWGSIGVMTTLVTLSLAMVIPQQYAQIMSVMELIDESVNIENKINQDEIVQ